MANIERRIISYLLVFERSIMDFNEQVNILLEDGYQFMNNDGYRLETDTNGRIHYVTQMVRYEPELMAVNAVETRTMPPEIARRIANTQVDRTIERMGRATERAVRDEGESDIITHEEHQRRMARLQADAGDFEIHDVVDDVMEDEVDDGPRTPPNPNRTPPNFWTVDGRDPFEDDLEEEDNEETGFNDHQLRRMGMQEEEDEREFQEGGIAEDFAAVMAGTTVAGATTRTVRTIDLEERTQQEEQTQDMGEMPF